MSSGSSVVSSASTNSIDIDKCSPRRDEEDVISQSSLAAALESNCWISMIDEKKKQQEQQQQDGRKNSEISAPKRRTKSGGARRMCCSSDSANPVSRGLSRMLSAVKWVLRDFALRHLVWIKLVFLFQSASMTVLYPYLNLHMKSLGISVREAALINAVVPVLFIFTPPLAGFLADRLGNFRVLLSILTGLGGLVALLLLVIPAGRDVSAYPTQLNWGLSCGKPDNRARFQKLRLHGFRRDHCQVASTSYLNVSFTPGTCGYLCPTRARVVQKPRFFEYKVIWPNRGGGFGISEIVDVVTLDSDEARMYHEPDLVDENIFFPMNWTFHLSCDRIRPNDCIFNPIRRAPSRTEYQLQALFDSALSGEGLSFDVESITPPETGRPVTVPVNCGAKEVIAQVISTVETDSLPLGSAAREVDSETVDTRFSGCTLQCLVNVPREQVCLNSDTRSRRDPALTFWCYLLTRTALGVLTAASLMMFEGAVMATIQELGGDYGIQRFVGNFGAIVFAPLGGFLMDASEENFAPAIYVYLALKLTAALMILCIQLDFRPPGERILQNLSLVLRNAEVVFFLVQMLFAGAFWGFIECFLFWHLNDLGATHLQLGWTVAVGMLVSLPFLVFSGPITDLLGHVNVVVLGMLAYAVRMLGYSLISEPTLVYPFEALEGLTMALMMTSAVTYVAKISGPKTVASVMGIMGALFFGVGKGSGSLFGGMAMSYVGARNTFRFFSANALVCAVSYAFFQCFYIRRKRKKRQQPPGDAEKTREKEAEGNVNKAYEDVVVITKQEPSVAAATKTTERPKSEEKVMNERSIDVEINTGPRSLTGGTRV